MSAGSTLEQPITNMSLGNENHTEGNLAERFALDVTRKLSDGATSSNHWYIFIFD